MRVKARLEPLLCTVALIGFCNAPPVFAEEDGCIALSKLASAIMNNRQAKVPMTDMMAIAQKDDGPLRDVMIAMVIAAYESPAYSTDEVKAETVSDFSNSVALECYKSRS